MSTIFDIRNLVSKVPRRVIFIGALVMALGIVGVFAGRELYRKLTTNSVVAYFSEAIALYPGDKVEIMGVRVGSIDKIEPTGDKMRVTFHYSNKYQVPANATASILNPSLVASRTIQLSPAYTSGPVLKDGAVIPIERTQVPVEWDHLRDSINGILRQLGPTPEHPKGPFGEVVESAADNLAGKGKQINEALNSLSDGLSALNEGRGDFVVITHSLAQFISALYKNTTGGYNTADGNSALSYNTTGSYNTALGYNAGPDSASTSLTNATAIGANAVVSQSNALVLGNGVNVGIGTAKPAYSLDVNGTGNFTGLVKFASSQTFPNTISGITTASGSGLTGGGTSGTLNLSLVTSCATGQVLAWNGSAWACTNLSGGGTVTSVALTAPSTDFIVTGSPVKTSGTLGLGWLVAPDPKNTANSIVKRDSSGNFSAGNINAATGFSLGGNLFAFGGTESNAFLGFAGNTATLGFSTGNTGTGFHALFNNSSGSENTATGDQALKNNTQGSNNTATGSAALSSNSSGSYNTATGSGALFANTASGNTATGFNALTMNGSGGYNTATGMYALGANTSGSSNTATGNNALSSNSAGQYNTATGSGALLNNLGDANNNGWYNTASGAQALYSNTLSSYNVADGYQALYSNAGDTTYDGWANVAVGAQALYSNTLGSYNTAVGGGALYYNTGDSKGNGSYNTGIGSGALYYNTLGYNNTAVGQNALVSNTLGYRSTAVGQNALVSNTLGYNNTAVGQNALSSNTGDSSGGGSHNTALGTGALQSNTTASGNTAVGEGALGSNITGYLLTCIGASCGVTADGLTNATAIGANAAVGESNALVLGSVNGVNNASSNVKVGIGTTTPPYVFTIGQNAGKAVADGWNTWSSRRWKTNIQTLHGALGKVEQLRGVSYDLKANGQHEVGVIAEEVGAVVPEVVTWEKNGKDAAGVDYGRLTALLIEATKEQQALIQKQQEQIKIQQMQIQAERERGYLQQARIARLTRQVKTIQATLKANGQTGSAVRTVKAEGTTVRQ